MGCFLGFELHLVINDYGELMAFKLTGATVDDHISKLSVS
ncbi:TPA: transposase [Legionella pneumophila]|nr:transposase [Legionella pneumophila]